MTADGEQPFSDRISSTTDYFEAERHQTSQHPLENCLPSAKMVFILGVNFSERQLVKRSLTSFFGIGEHQCGRLMARFHIHPTATVGELANRQVLDMTTALTHMKIENDLKREVLDNIKRLKDTGTYRGRRHAINLPVRGQSTRTQHKTAVKLNRIDRKL